MSAIVATAPSAALRSDSVDHGRKPPDLASASATAASTTTVAQRLRPHLHPDARSARGPSHHGLSRTWPAERRGSHQYASASSEGGWWSRTRTRTPRRSASASAESALVPLSTQTMSVQPSAARRDTATAERP